MTQTFTAVYEQHGDWWIGQAQELPGAIVQERTLEEAREIMREVIPLILDTQDEVEAKGSSPIYPIIPRI